MVGLPFAALVQIDISQSADWRDSGQIVRRSDTGLLLLPCPDPVTGRLMQVPAEPVDLTLSELEMEIAPSYGDSRTITSLSSSGGSIVITDRPNALFAFNVLMANVSSWPAGHWSFVMRAITGSAHDEVMRGPFNIHPRIF